MERRGTQRRLEEKMKIMKNMKNMNSLAAREGMRT